jgi:hypothetical protein
MLYNKKKNTIIWLPHKICSTSLRGYFREDTTWEVYHSRHYVSPLYFPTHVDHHGVTYPTETNFSPALGGRTKDSYRRVLPLRNPYDRVVSMWKFHIALGFKENFEEWFAQIFMFHPSTLPATRIFAGHYDETIITENIESELKRLNLDHGEFPHLNKTQGTHELTSSQKQIISHFHKEDFLKGGYNI